MNQGCSTTTEAAEAEFKEEEGENLFSDIITLRPMEVTDIDDFMGWVSDEKVANFCNFEPYTDKEIGINYIKSLPTRSNRWFRAICLNNKAVGATSVTINSGKNICRGELGYLLAYKYWGKGIATAAVKLVAKAIFNERPQLERLEALVDVENLGSQRVLEKVGFKTEGVSRKYYIQKGRTRDMVMFSLLSTDPPVI